MVRLDEKLQKQADAIRATQPKLDDYVAADEAYREQLRKEQPLALLIDMAFQQRELKRKLDREVKEMGAIFDELEFGIIQRMEDQGDELNPLTTAGGLLASVSVVEEEVQNVDPDQWPNLYEWIADNRAAYLLQKRLSSGAVAELLREGTELPGVTTITRKKLNLRAR